VLRAARRALLSSLGALRIDQATLRTRWRRNRLLILGYHGVALDDEHHWDPELYMTAAVLCRRLELIRDAGCRVLPLDDAVRRLYAGDLPPRSVALTFDDGGYDFYARAFPIVEAFGYRNLEFEGWEADDVIATLATQADEAGIKTTVVSTDRDAFQ